MESFFKLRIEREKLKHCNVKINCISSLIAIVISYKCNISFSLLDKFKIIILIHIFDIGHSHSVQEHLNVYQLTPKIHYHIKTEFYNEMNIGRIQ